MELKEKIADLKKKLEELAGQSRRKECFLAAVRKFMEMGTLTAPLLQELIDHIDVYETEGTGKNRTQRIAITYYSRLVNIAIRFMELLIKKQDSL